MGKMDLYEVQKFVNSLSVDEILKLWEQNICYKGVYLDSVLKRKIEELSHETRQERYMMDSGFPYFDEYTIYALGDEKYHHISYLWVEPRDCTRVSARFDQEVPICDGEFRLLENRYVEFYCIFKRELDEKKQYSSYLEIQTITNESKYLEDNDVQYVHLGNMDGEELVWDNKVKNLKVKISEKDLEEKSFIDIPISCFSCKFLLRIMLNPYSFSYYVCHDGNICLKKCLIKRKMAVSVPAMIDGKKVNRIGKRCFFNCKDVLAVSISEGVTSIGSFAFDGCENMESIKIPKTISEIGRYAFCGCKRVNSICLPNSVTEIRSYTFAGCYSLTKIIIPEGCEKIAYRAFVGSGLRSVVIPKSVINLERYAFKCRYPGLMVAIPMELDYLIKEKAKRHWFGHGSNGRIDRIEEMNFSLAHDVFETGTILCFYNSQYKVVKISKVQW